LNKRRVTTASLDATVNLANPASYATAGAAPNGADYVTLQKANGKPLGLGDLRAIKCQGAKTLPPVPLAWQVVSDDPDRSGNPVLWSGNG
ncbi:peptidase M6 immune inhibitor A, partial [Escherichia coli]|nr:peptidase M6 immune inhibitor A [Escherichia coli]